MPSVFERYRVEIDAELRSVLNGRRFPLYDLMKYHLGWMDERGHLQYSSGGKALRPTLCLLACEAAGGDRWRTLPAAAAIELVHNFSLIHDDIQDNDRERHHRPTVWRLWGKPQAINAGSAMRVLGSLLLLALRRRRVPGPKVLAAQRLLDENCLAMIEGQYLDISYENRLDIKAADYLDMIERKTAALIGCSAEMGVMLGGGNRVAVCGFRKFGRNLGMAFQIRDDILGIWGDEKLTGKPAGNDIRRRKKSFPVVYALGKAEGKRQKALTDIYSKRAIDETDLQTVLRTMESLKVRDYAQGVARQYGQAAMAGITDLDLEPQCRKDLGELAHFLVERDY